MLKIYLPNKKGPGSTLEQSILKKSQNINKVPYYKNILEH